MSKVDSLSWMRCSESMHMQSQNSIHNETLLFPKPLASFHSEFPSCDLQLVDRHTCVVKHIINLGELHVALVLNCVYNHHLHERNVDCHWIFTAGESHLITRYNIIVG